MLIFIVIVNFQLFSNCFPFLEAFAEKEAFQTPPAASKPKYIPVQSVDGQAQLNVLFPGRRQCMCMATRHALINNCVGCGRVVCKQEGSGPCLFCGSLVSCCWS